jgi:DNA polymerase zeta
MFVLLEGKTREEAHAIGQEIAAAVTETNPPPVTLKMEKVYHPCVLLTKKRYVGYSYESASQLKPILDAKGIETIRRDSCPAVAKALEHSLRILFETQDLSQVNIVLPLDRSLTKKFSLAIWQCLWIWSPINQTFREH